MSDIYLLAAFGIQISRPKVLNLMHSYVSHSNHVYDRNNHLGIDMIHECFFLATWFLILYLYTTYATPASIEKLLFVSVSQHINFFLSLYDYRNSCKSIIVFVPTQIRFCLAFFCFWNKKLETIVKTFE